jgi:GNAT superfamily N-acetyltransferase
MESVRILPSENPEKTYQVVVQELREFNKSFLGQYESVTIAVDVINADQEIVGGAFGSVQLGWLFIDVIWLQKNYRQVGNGTAVLKLLEEKARQLGASRATLDTMGFQAEKLYEKTATPNLDDLPTLPPGMTEYT